MCGAPQQGGGLAGIDLTRQTVIQGSVWHEGAPVAGAYVRLLDSTDETWPVAARDVCPACLTLAR